MDISLYTIPHLGIVFGAIGTFFHLTLGTSSILNRLANKLHEILFDAAILNLLNK